jgi:nucleotide-binding universal stress UspA family protein
MFRILVPIDFYKTSYAAFNYAANFSKLFPNAEITLLHVINGSFNSNDVVTFDPMLELEDAALKKIRFFHEKYSDEVGNKLPKVNVKEEVRFGIPGFTIAEYAKNNKIDIVIMGTRDQHNLFDKILGSASAITLRLSNCPVMLIHENVKYNTPKKVVFAFDNKSDLEDALENYGKLNAVINAKTDFVHVSKKKKADIEHQKAEILEEIFDKVNPIYPFEIKSIQSNDLHNTLKDYCLFEKSDLLIMMHRKEGIFNKVFRTHNSVKMAQEFHLPVMVFHEDD